MKTKLIPIILAGGKGERFWPVSRLKRPKQFLCLDGGNRSLMQATADRLLNLAGGWDNLWVITSEIIAEGVKKQLPDLPESNILVEPQGKDTAPAVAWATLEVAKKHGKDAIVGFSLRIIGLTILQLLRKLLTQQPSKLRPSHLLSPWALLLISQLQATDTLSRVQKKVNLIIYLSIR